jgi:hypothetical protein
MLIDDYLEEMSYVAARQLVTMVPHKLGKCKDVYSSIPKPEVLHHS